MAGFARVAGCDMVQPSRQRPEGASVRVAAAIMLVLFALGGCRSAPEAARADGDQAPAPIRAGTALSCVPWPDGERPPGDSGLVRSPEQEVPGTDSTFGTPVQVTVGLACANLPPRRDPVALYCGAAEPGTPPRPCLVGEECAIGSIMVTEVTRFQEGDGSAACAVFENWSKTRPRTIWLWAKPR
jgi:hypothetical protein